MELNECTTLWTKLHADKYPREMNIALRAVYVVTVTFFTGELYPGQGLHSLWIQSSASASVLRTKLFLQQGQVIHYDMNLNRYFYNNRRI